MKNCDDRQYDIHHIESLTEPEAQEIALETMQIKGHNVYFVDFKGYFKYSVLVFAEGKHIYYANDYELHHPGKTLEELREWYIDTLNLKLYTEDEIVGPVDDYDDYKAKDYFLHNYYGMRRDYVSIFHIGDKPRRDTTGMIYDPVAFAYFDRDDADFVQHHVELCAALEKSWKAKQNEYEFMKSAFISEMWNHEYAINWQGDYDVLSVFGNIHYDRSDDLQNYFNQLHFTDVQRRAYLDAVREYMNKANA